MCIMEVRPGQHSSTISQAMAHNTSTIERDLDLLRELLESRKEDHLLPSLERAQFHLKAAYAVFLDIFGECVAKHPLTDTTHVRGNERTLVEAAHHDATLARRYETR